MGLIYRMKSLYNLNSLQGKVYYLLITLGILISIINTVSNYLLDLGVVLVLTTFFTGIFCLVMLIVTIKSGQYLKSAYLTSWVLILVIYPSLWISNGGSDGPTLGVYIFNTVLIAVIFDKRKARILMTLKMCTIPFLFMLEKYYPHLINGYENADIRMIDIIVGTYILIFFSYVIIDRIMKEYKSRIYELDEIREKLHLLSITDELTGLYNRRHIFQEITKQLNNQTECTYTVIMFDIDDFKKINDNYGHTVGDEVISTVGDLLKSNTRESDVVGRIGGEEFLVLLLGLSEEEAYIKAENLRQAVCKYHWSIENMVVTVSGGVYEGAKNDDLESLLEKVDRYLYKAKTNGKNQIVS